MRNLVKSIDDICFIDSETSRPAGCAGGSVMEVGAYAYAQHAFASIWAFAIGRDPTRLMSLDDDFDERLTWELDAPDDLKRFHDRVLAGKAFYAAWNMNFDRLIWNGPLSDFPHIEPEHTIDVMAQATAAGTPGKLGAAAAWIGASGKLDTGTSLISLFEPPTGKSPQDAPEKWDDFKTYAVADVDALRGIYERTLPLPRKDWEDYWVSERINDRGFAVDVDFCEAAARAVAVNEKRMNEQIVSLTAGEVPAVTAARAMLLWVVRMLDGYPEAAQMFIHLHEVKNDEGKVTRPEKLSMERSRIEQVLAYLDAVENELTVDAKLAYDVLTLRLHGGSNTPKKYGKAAAMAHEGRLHGQYVFGGAAQTGRFASRGIQLHNLARAHLGDDEEPAIEAVKALAAC